MDDMNLCRHFDVKYIDPVGYCFQFIVTLTFLATTSYSFTEACFAILPVALFTVFLAKKKNKG